MHRRVVPRVVPADFREFYPYAGWFSVQLQEEIGENTPKQRLWGSLTAGMPAGVWLCALLRSKTTGAISPGRPHLLLALTDPTGTAIRWFSLEWAARSPVPMAPAAITSTTSTATAASATSFHCTVPFIRAVPLAATATAGRRRAPAADEHVDPRALCKGHEHGVVARPISSSEAAANLVRESDRGWLWVKGHDCVEALLKPHFAHPGRVRGGGWANAVVPTRAPHFPLGKHVDHGRRESGSST